MSEAAELSAVAVEEIDEWGMEVAYVARGESVYDEETSTNTAGETQKSPKVLVGTSMAKAKQAVETGDQMIYVAAATLGATPTIADSVTVDGKKYSVVDWNTYYVQATPVLYEIHTRRR